MLVLWEHPPALLPAGTPRLGVPVGGRLDRFPFPVDLFAREQGGNRKPEGFELLNHVTEHLDIPGFDDRGIRMEAAS